MIKKILLYSAMAALVEAQRSPAIVSISFCSPTGAVGQGSCHSGTFDTHQLVLGPGAVSVNKSSLGAGAAVKDPTAPPRALLLVYEGTDDYISLDIATSLDYGKTRPTYRGTSTFSFVPMPGVNRMQAPSVPMGALGENVRKALSNGRALIQL